MKEVKETPKQTRSLTKEDIITMCESMKSCALEYTDDELGSAFNVRCEVNGRDLHLRLMPVPDRGF